MGADIHPHLEIVDLLTDKAEYISEVDFGRDYTLFGLMAGVRRDIEIFSPRGLPNNVSGGVKEEHKSWNGDAHTPSFLYIDELEQIQEAYVKEVIKGLYYDFNEYKKVYGFWQSKDIENILAKMKQLQMDDKEPRLVFWFDN